MNGAKKLYLDFIIVGAQKAGTTALYKYLSTHPQLHLPPEKEAPFFSVDTRYESGLEAYLNEFFSGAPTDQLWGKATPQYMGDVRVPQRMAEIFPNVKLIALLRDPVDRAISHFKMSVRRARDTRSFDEAVTQQLTPSALIHSRALQPTAENEKNCYVVWGEYGRILAEYLRWFPRDQLLVMFTTDLAANPRSAYLKVCEFLEIDQGWTPPNLGKRYHIGGTRRKYPRLEQLTKNRGVKSVLRWLPAKQLRQLRYWYEQWSVDSKGDDDIVVSKETRWAMQRHYASDTLLLRDLLSVTPPWYPLPSNDSKPTGVHVHE